MKIRWLRFVPLAVLLALYWSFAHLDGRLSQRARPVQWDQEPGRWGEPFFTPPTQTPSGAPTGPGVAEGGQMPGTLGEPWTTPTSQAEVETQTGIRPFEFPGLEPFSGAESVTAGGGNTAGGGVAGIASGGGSGIAAGGANSTASGMEGNTASRDGKRP